MMLNIHLSAADNFDKKASELVKLVKELPPETSQTDSFPSETLTAGTITDDDIIGDIDVARADYKENIIARYFHINEKRFGLEEESYKYAIKIAESIQSLPTVRSKISCEFVQDALFKWIKNNFQGIDIPDSFIEYLDNEVSSKIETITSWVPIASLEVELPFPIANSEIRPLSKCFFDEWERRIGSPTNGNSENILKRFNKRRKEYQGLAAVVTVIEAEPEHALKYTMEEALRITSVLGLFSAGTMLPDVKCVSTIKGFESIARLTTFFEDSNGNLNTLALLVDAASSKSWRLSQRDIIEIRRIALDRISSLLASDSLHGFERAALNYGYIRVSQQAKSPLCLDRCIYCDYAMYRNP